MMGEVDYIEEEIQKYIEEKRNGIDRFTTYENIMAYIRMAVACGRITEKEAEEIKRPHSDYATVTFLTLYHLQRIYIYGNIQSNVTKIYHHTFLPNLLKKDLLK